MSDTKWTKEQQQAIDTRHCNLLVAAAAGSGKTAVLVERIIKIITSEEEPVDIDRLLVVTFTNAAAAEMRERIGDAIAKSLDKNPASKTLQRQLTLLNKANITTMHSFCLNIIKNNFHNIDLDPNFRIADATEEILLRSETVQELFEECYEESENSEDRYFLTLVESYGGGRDDLRLQELVLNLYEFIISGPWPESWLQEMWSQFQVSKDFDFGNSKWGKVIIGSIKIELKGLKAVVSKCMEELQSAEGLEPYIETFKKDLELIENLEKLCETSWNELHSGFTDYKFSTIARLSKKAEYDRELAERIKAVRDNSIKRKLNDLRDDIFRFEPENIKDNLYKLYPMMRCLGELVLRFKDKYSHKKRERGLLDFSDLEHFALDILTQVDEMGERTPSDTAKQFRSHFDEVLVDEYQDSNMVQEVIINMVSRKTDENPNVFMVGDIKQSIYRFRQAEPQLFLEKYENYSNEEGANNRVIKLYKNFRSREEIINGVNYIFRTIMSKTVGELEYTHEEALNLGARYKEVIEAKAITGGPLELNLIEKVEASKEESAADYEEELEDSSNALVDEEELDNIQLEARVVASRIRELMSRKGENVFKVYDKSIDTYRELQYRDIVILLRATRDYAPVFMEELNGEGIPVYSDANSGYFETIEIRTMLSLLQIIDNPLQDIPLIAVLRSPIFSFFPEELIDIRLVDKNIPFYKAIKRYIAEAKDSTTVSKVAAFLEDLRKWRRKALHMPIDELIWYLYSSTGYYGYAGAMPGGIQRQANLRILFERARQFENTSYKGLFNFVNFINRLRTSSGDMGSAKILGENENVVRIMSIHKSKGLEFPVVILSGTGKNFNLMDLNKTILFHQNLGVGPDYVDPERRISYPTMIKLALKRKIKLETLSEEMRILYVAFTRAKEKLIITGTVRSLESSCTKWCEGLDNSLEQVPEYTILKGRSYLDWIGPAVAKHIDGGPIRELLAHGGGKNFKIDEDPSRWLVNLWTKKDLALEQKDSLEPEENEAIEEVSVDCDYLYRIKEEKPESKFKEEIERRLSWQYLYKEASKLPAKLSVTELKRLGNELFSDQYTTNLFAAKLARKPLFLEEQKGLSGAERGTIVHFVMQHLDFRKVQSYEELDSQVKAMVMKELLTEEQAMSVSIKSIHNFFKSSIGGRMLAVKDFDKDIRRETPFFMKLKGSEIKKDLPEEIYKKDVILLQGVVDVYFREEDYLVLLDYKTDYATEENMEEIKNRYEKQLYYYSEALERMTGLKVKEKYIYLFSNGEIIKY